MATTISATAKPAAPTRDVPLEKVPGHWLLARMGKRVLRPSGIELTRRLLADLDVGVRPLTRDEWGEILAQAGLHVIAEHLSPMHLLEPRRVIQDEGFFRAIRFAFNVARTPTARKRVRAMRAVFRKYSKNLSAIALIAEKQ